MNNKITEHFKELEKTAIDGGASLFGVAELAPLKEYFHPLIEPLASKLPYAISIAIKLSDSIIDDIVDAPTLIYKHHYKSVNYMLDQVALAVCKKIDALGYRAAPIPSSQMVDWEKQLGHLSHRLVAWQAGIGHIGRSHLLVSREFGARIRLVTILTDIPLPAGKPLEGNCNDCGKCISSCPAQAITKEGLIRERCIAKLKEFTKIRGIGVSICGICVRDCAGEKTVTSKVKT
ncbi:MAG: epoxyqueuosine reductase [Candidatus Schekmanbacteria bacterium]|nr:epoxyqueuosine reductase [Candidatus Schekmanbacteria bacterium]